LYQGITERLIAREKSRTGARGSRRVQAASIGEVATAIPGH